MYLKYVEVLKKQSSQVRVRLSGEIREYLDPKYIEGNYSMEPYRFIVCAPKIQRSLVEIFMEFVAYIGVRVCVHVVQSCYMCALVGQRVEFTFKRHSLHYHYLRSDSNRCGLRANNGFNDPVIFLLLF